MCIDAQELYTRIREETTSLAKIFFDLISTNQYNMNIMQSNDDLLDWQNSI